MTYPDVQQYLMKIYNKQLAHELGQFKGFSIPYDAQFEEYYYIYEGFDDVLEKINRITTKYTRNDYVTMKVI